MYTVQGYIQMIEDVERVRAYLAALQRVVTSSTVLVEVGTGIGFFAIAAHKLGARRVIAIEPSDAISVARELARVNDCGGGIEFIQALASEVSLSEPADVVVSDLRGVLPLFEGHIEAIIDARRRLLAPGGLLIPEGDIVWAAVVEAPDLHKRQSLSTTGLSGIKLDVLGRFTTNTWIKARVRPEQLLSGPECWTRLDYKTIDNSNVTATLDWTMQRDGTAHGLLAWFETTLIDDIAFSNAPSSLDLIYGNGFFPFTKAVSVQQGDRASVRLQARRIGGDYIWRWNTEIWSRDSDTEPKARFAQSTLEGIPISPANLAKGAGHIVPALSDDGKVERFVLQCIDGRRSNDDIARDVMKQFPHRFATRADALGRVGAISQRFSAGGHREPLAPALV